MKGIITKYTHLRSRPSVNAPILAYLDINETVFIRDIVWGDEVDENDEWYQLQETGFVSCMAVKPDSPLHLNDTEDLIQYLISYRKTNPYGKPKTDSTDIPERLSFQRLVLPALYENLNMHDDVDFFVGNIADELSRLKSSKRHVILYVPGYQPLPNLSFELWENFVQNYMEHPAQSVAKVIFFSWPSHQLGRKTIDDRAIHAGEKFGQNRLYEVITRLAKALPAGKTLNLVVHSFGHQLLNGFLNSGVIFNKDSRVFHRIFLMAPDIAEGAMYPPWGIHVRNFYGGNTGSFNLYNLSGIHKIAAETHVFWDKYDYLLHVSTRKFAEKVVGTDEEYPQILNYRNLGNYGPKYNNPGVYYHNLQALLNSSPDKSRFKNLYDQPKWRKRMDTLMNDQGSYLDVGDILTLALNNGKFARHHRYLFTSKAVVEKVMELLNSGPPAAPDVT